MTAFLCNKVCDGNDNVAVMHKCRVLGSLGLGDVAYQNEDVVFSESQYFI